MKEKGSMYKSPINKEINNSQKVYSTLYESDANNSNQSNLTNNFIQKNITDYRSVERKIYDILHSNDYIYKANVTIVLKDGTINKKIIGKTKDKLITMDNEYINISDIKDIYKEKRN